MSSNKKQPLKALEQQILSDGVCLELAEQAHGLVFGDGNIDAKIVFIGEAPGKKEDEMGLPFVGASGKSLDKMLAGIGLERGDVYITNIVKYRPPNNRDPSRKEKSEFWPYLLKQLEIINPDIVVTLGRHSMEQFLPEQKIGTAHGVIFDLNVGEYQGLILPLYHPAAAMYNGKLRQTLLDDFEELKQFG